MTPEQSRLWHNIQKFQLDEPSAVFRFSSKLARQNGWTPGYANRVIAEYKKFMLMSCIAAQGVCPSQAVDEAWHLHLTYTYSYWIEFCGKVLKRQIHHHPTKGGSVEDDKHGQIYAETKRLYIELFKTMPPEDIWPSGTKDCRKFKQVDTNRHWIIRKPKMAWVVLLALAFVPVIFIQAVPAEYTPIIMLGILAFAVISLYKKYGEEEDEVKRRNNDNGSCSGDSGGDGGSCWGDNDSHSGHHGHSCHSGGHSCSGSCSSGDGCSSGCCSGGGD